MIYKVGMDAGSTTLKVVVLDEQNRTLYKTYKRHFSKVREALLEELFAMEDILKGNEVKIVLTGSAGYGIAKQTNLSFVQEVFVTAYLVKEDMEEVDVVVELGGEDAKIIFLTGGLEERMNSTCAGGTGAFIDQMAVLMNVTGEELDELSKGAKTLYPIASRCGVFAKSDIQPLLNQGAKKEDLSASIFQSVVDQTIAGLAQGRPIKGNVLFLGGPLSFYKGLQRRFIETLKRDHCHPIFPLDGQSFVAMGCARYAEKEQKTHTYEELVTIFKAKPQSVDASLRLPALFESQEAYAVFRDRHASYVLPEASLENYEGKAYLGIDAGSTTTKIVLIGEDNEILYQYYAPNEGNPVEVVRKQLIEIHKVCAGRVQIQSSGVTGYGEDLIQNAFGVDVGTVETVAHFRAASHFDPQVDFILDIGGQDMKCFKIKNGTIDSIMLNEACSSGCGSFIETFAKQLGYEVQDFAKLGLFAKGPVDLGTRCTVFMNSSVKQAQKEGATVEDVSAGLAISVIKNALYKVIRAKSTSDLGTHIVVQGGTLYNDAILRSLEMELGREVVRPTIAGLMGAFGVALYAKEHQKDTSTLASLEELLHFSHTATSVNCGLCTNKCHLTVNKFGDRKFISGNRCERPIKGKQEELPNLYQFKYDYIRSLEVSQGDKGTIGIPVVLNMYENLPFWSTFFKELGYRVALSEASSKSLYVKGQHTIPSDTVCYPAKLTHGHIESLLDQGVSHIFYPCMAYNVDEGISDNCYNCPVVAYYPELLQANIADLEKTDFIAEYVSLNDKKVLDKALYQLLNAHGIAVKKAEVKKATQKGYDALETYRKAILQEGEKAIRFARETKRQMVVLGGRPYHVDPEINHGIDRMLTGLGAVVLSEDSLGEKVGKPKVKLLNQWTYHARLYHAAHALKGQEDMHFVHLVSFGCGTDALTSDIVKDILEENDKLYTQLKIDETSNLGAARIRIRSMFAGAEGRKER